MEQKVLSIINEIRKAKNLAILEKLMLRTTSVTTLNSLLSTSLN